MASGCIPHLLLALLVLVESTMLVAGDCASSSLNTVGISASSYRKKTGHWITKAALTRRIPKGIGDVQNEEWPFEYDIDISRQSCHDGEVFTTTFNILGPGPPQLAQEAASESSGNGPGPLQLARETSTETSDNATPNCSSALYEFFPDIGCYKLHTDKKNWEDARRTCETEGAHLAIVNSEAEEKALVELMKPHDIEYFAFIGFHDKDKEGEYVTVFGDPLSSTGYVRWAEGEPNNALDWAPEGEDCGVIYKFGPINDVSCGGKLHFICEL